MSRRTMLLVLTTGLAALVACGDIVGFGGSDVLAEFEAEAVSSSTAEDHTAAEGMAGAVSVRGIFIIPCSNYRRDVSARKRGQVLTLTLDYKRDPEICLTDEVTLRYTARLAPIDRGMTTVRVQRRDIFTGSMEVVLDTTVAVS